MEEKNKKKYLKLFASCIPVNGYTRSLIIDTQRNDFYFIPNALYYIIKDNLKLPVSEIYDLYKENKAFITEYINFLLSKELAFYTNDPQSFPNIDERWECPRIITNAIVDINDISTYDYFKVISEIDKLGAEAIEIRFFNDIEFNWLLKFLKNVTNITVRLRSIQLVIKYNESLRNYPLFEDELEKIDLVSMVVIHGCDQNIHQGNDRIQFLYTKQNIKDETHCGMIHPSYFSTNINHVLEALNYNTCLNRKISINTMGEIKNCPSMEMSYGNIKTTSLFEVVKLDEFQKKWKIKKEQINECRDCEFRLICTDCRAYVNGFAKPAKCTYNPYTALWNN